MVFTAEQFWKVINAGLLEEPELIGGYVGEESLQSPEHWAVYAALQMAVWGAMQDDRRMRCAVLINVSPVDVYEAEMAVVRDCPGIPHASDVHLALEIACESLFIDLGPKKRGYARAGVPHYWVFDAVHGRLHAFSYPEGEAYRIERILTAGEKVAVPGVSAELDLSDVFSP